MTAHSTPAGALVLSCELDQNCVQLDCETLLPDLPESLTNSPELPDYLAHYCGLDYLAKHGHQEGKAEADESSLPPG